jgi:hypothetical protein
MRLHTCRKDLAASRRYFGESLRLRAVAEDARSISYDAGDVVLVLDWTLDHTASSVEDEAQSDVVLLADEIEAVRAALESCGVRFTRTDRPAISFAAQDGPEFVILDLSDECLMWPSAGWRAGPCPG